MDLACKLHDYHRLLVYYNFVYHYMATNLLARVLTTYF
nr:MAG TPA: hypothetical protein [Bacteriophage sp.]